MIFFKFQSRSCLSTVVRFRVMFLLAYLLLHSTDQATTPTADLPVIHDDTLLIPTNTPTISPIVPTIPSISLTIQLTSLFVCTDSSDSDTPDTPPIHDTPPVEISPSIRQILPASPGLPRQPTVLVLPGKPIPVGRHYRNQPNGTLFFRSSYISDSPCDSPTATSARPSRKRRRDFDSVTDSKVSSEEGFVPYVDIDDCIAFADDIAARGTDVTEEVGTAAEEE
nr:hypothetical protein [Tanacetum cinerariifolium]